MDDDTVTGIARLIVTVGNVLAVVVGVAVVALLGWNVGRALREWWHEK